MASKVKRILEKVGNAVKAFFEVEYAYRIH